jgi:sorting nexin-29
VLEKVTRDASLNTRRTIFYKSVQILAYANDTDITGRIETAINLEEAAKKMHLQINQEKTKYMPVTKKACTDGPSHTDIGSCKFEIVHSFKYLGSEDNCKNDFSAEIQKRILSASMFPEIRKHLKSHLISSKTKMMLHKILERPVLTHASEIWTLSKTDDRLLSLFERRVLRHISAGPENGMWRKRYSHEL